MKWMVSDVLKFLQVLEIKEITGLQNIKKNVIVVANHQSFLDGFFVMGYIPCVPLMKSSYKFNPLFAWIAPFFNFIEIEFTPAGIIKADKKIRNLLKNKESVFILPEGTRSCNEKIKKFNSLAFKIANDLKIPILPITVYYSKPIMSKLKSSFIFSQKIDVKIHISQAIIPSQDETTAKLLTKTQSVIEEEFEKMRRQMES